MNKKYYKYINLALVGYLLAGCGGNSNSDPATTSPQAEANAVPVASADSAVIVDNTVTSIDVLENDTDADEDSLTITEIVTPPNFGTATIVNNEIEFTPQQNFAGADTLIYRVSDGELTADAELSLSLTQSLTLSGEVDGLGETTATFNVQVGDEVISFETDGEDAYEVAITLTDSDQIVQLNAMDEEQQPVLVGLLGGAEVLVEASGEDRVLSADENTAVDLNLFSTAFFLLSEDANGNQPIESAETLTEISTNLNAASIVDVAAFIQVLTTNSEFTPDADSTSALIASNVQATKASQSASVLAILDDDSFQTTQEAIQQYLVDNDLVDELGDPIADYLTARDEAIFQLISTDSLNSDFASLVTLLFNQPNITIPAQQPGFVTSFGNFFTLNESGTGRIFTGFDFGSLAVPSAPLTWEIIEGQLVLSYSVETSSFVSASNFVIAQDFGQEVANFLIEQSFMLPAGQVEQINRTTGQSISLLKNNGDNLQVIIETRSERELIIPEELDFGPNPLVTTQSVNSFNIPTQFASVLADVEQSEILGTWAIPIITDLEQIEGEFEQRVIEVLTLDESGSSTGPFSGITYNWSFSDGVIRLENENERYEYLPFRLNGDEYQGIMTRFVDDEVIDQQLAVMAQFNDTASQFTDNLVTSIPEVYVAHIGNTNPEDWLGDTLRVSSVFGHQFNDDGTMRRAINASEGIVSDGDFHFSFDSDFWTLVDNKVRIRRSSPVSTIMGRDWEVISVDETGRALVIETILRRINDENDNGDLTDDPVLFILPPRLNSFTVVDLSIYPEVFNNTDFTQAVQQKSQKESQLLDLDQVKQR
ncbi:hypothetical protein EYS14_18585 [Alteromonadaceae bacterium M269]|nr:hypothetical protein EYS14_18585 [Alteromonadaceae bacterium M269]